MKSEQPQGGLVEAWVMAFPARRSENTHTHKRKKLETTLSDLFFFLSVLMCVCVLRDLKFLVGGEIVEGCGGHCLNARVSKLESTNERKAFLILDRFMD